MSIPNLAPEVEDVDVREPRVAMVNAAPAAGGGFAMDVVGPQPADGPRKKKYAKEAWPGRKPTHGLLV